jgi:GNAT superfamily N-acetyltransferase
MNTSTIRLKIKRQQPVTEAAATEPEDLSTDALPLDEIRANVKAARAKGVSITLAKVGAHSGPLAYEALPIPDSLDFCIIMSLDGFKAKRGDFIDDTGNRDPFGLSGTECGAMYLHRMDPARVKGLEHWYSLVCNVKVAKSQQGIGLGVRLYNRALKTSQRYYKCRGLTSNPADRNHRSNPFWKKYGQGRVARIYDCITVPLPEKFKLKMPEQKAA